MKSFEYFKIHLAFSHRYHSYLHQKILIIHFFPFFLSRKLHNNINVHHHLYLTSPENSSSIMRNIGDMEFQEYCHRITIKNFNHVSSLWINVYFFSLSPLHHLLLFFLSAPPKKRKMQKLRDVSQRHEGD